MKVMASFFLRAKHWQMFLLLFGLMSISQVAAEPIHEAKPGYLLSVSSNSLSMARNFAGSRT
jgi:hypothetical protein